MTQEPAVATTSRMRRLLFAILFVTACSSSGSSPPRDGAGTGGAGAGGAGGSTGGSPATGGATATGGASATGGTGQGTGGSTTPDAAPPAAPDAAVSSADAAPAPSIDASVAGQHALLVWGYGEHDPTPKATDPPKGFDLQMKARLEARGLVVDLRVDALSTAADAAGKAVVVISSSINRENLFDARKPRFQDAAVPTIVMKDGTIEVMGLGMGSAGGFSTEVGETKISIVAPEDPLAAGLTGDVTVYTKGDRLIWAQPGAAARKIATVVGKATEVTIFAYDKGAMMTGGPAPAKRMGFFIHRNTSYSADGLKLFDAALDYLLAP
jgi:hypothetical protein